MLDDPDIDDWHQWWVVKNLIGHVQSVDESYTNGALRVTSGYRCPRGNRRAGGSPNSWHMQGVAFDFNQQSSEENYNVWKAASGASHRYLYDQNNKRYDENILFQYPWPLMPPGVTAYTHGHVDWR